MLRLATLLCLLAAAAPISAQEAPAPLPPGLLGAQILPGWRSEDGQRIAAVQIDLAPGWKTYWRVPGDAGVPPVLRFDASQNLAHLRVGWPAPEVFEVNGMQTVGYHDRLILPLEIEPADPAQPVALVADLDLGICHEVCVPVQLSLSASLEGKGAADPQIAAAIAAEPKPSPGLAQCTTEPIRDGVRVKAEISVPEAAGQVALFELRSTPMWVSEPQSARAGDILQASAEFVPEDGRPFALDQTDLRITVVSEAGAIEIDGCPQPE